MSEIIKCVFRLDSPDSEAAFLIGEFNNWSTSANPMQRTNKGTWETSIEVEAGSYHYGYFLIEPNPSPTSYAFARLISFMDCGNLQAGPQPRQSAGPSLN